MFVLTMKFNKRTAVLIVSAVAVLLAGIVIALSTAGKDGENPVKLGLGIGVKTNGDRLAYLSELGWECEEQPIEEEEIVIPRTFSHIFEEYNELQRQQGFDLSDYKGLECTMYRYKVINYPGSDQNVIAQIIVLNYQVIAGDIHSTALDGFMHGIK